MKQSTESTLREIFWAVLNLPSGTDLTNTSPATLPEWDSLAHALLITAIESEFGLQIDPAESLDLTSYHAATVLLEARNL